MTTPDPDPPWEGHATAVGVRLAWRWEPDELILCMAPPIAPWTWLCFGPPGSMFGGRVLVLSERGARAEEHARWPSEGALRALGVQSLGAGGVCVRLPAAPPEPSLPRLEPGQAWFLVIAHHDPTGPHARALAGLEVWL